MTKKRIIIIAAALAVLLAAAFLFLPQLSRLLPVSLQIKMRGAALRDGIYITENALIEDITAGDDTYLTANIEGMTRYIDGSRTPAVVVLVPTAAAILQQELPANSELLNQKALISYVYGELSGKAGTADAYSQLFSARDSQLYCRTASNLTGLGGYHVYTALASRLGLTARTLDEFEIEGLPQDYRGDLYERVPAQNVAADTPMLYHYTRSDRAYSMLCVRDGEAAQYTTLYPRHLAALGRVQDVPAGGAAQLRDITVCAPDEPSLLIFCDDTAMSYLPFLATHCSHITTLDPRTATAEQLASVDDDDYDRVLFCCSVKTILQENIYANMGE